MRRRVPIGRPVLRVAAMASLLVALANAQAPRADLTYVQVEGRRVKEAIHADVDGDGRKDLVIATGLPAETPGPPRRWLQVHLRREGSPPFVAVPDHDFEVVRDVVAYAVADVNPHPGKELVLFSPSLAAGVYWDADKTQPTVFKIAPVRLLWQPARRVQTIDLQDFVVDFDHDGHDDLLIPEPDGYRVLMQRIGEDGDVHWDTFELAVPQRRATKRDEGETRLKAQADTLRLRLREDEREQVFTLLECADSVPPPALADWDGDGDIDVVALADRDLCVWTYDGGFAAAPTLEHELPPFEGSILNPSNFVRVADVNGDHRLDVVFVAGRVKDDDVVSYVEIYVQGEDGAIADAPADRLMLQGFVDVPRIEDVDGDGAPELVVGSLRPDLIGTISAGGTGSIDGQVNVFRNEFTPDGGRFGRPVAMVEKVGLTGDVMKGRFRERMLATFFHDVNGDGRPDFLQRTNPERVVVRLTNIDGSRFTLGDPVWDMHVDAGARVVPVTEADGHVALIAIEDEQVVYAEFR